MPTRTAGGTKRATGKTPAAGKTTGKAPATKPKRAATAAAAQPGKGSAKAARTPARASADKTKPGKAAAGARTRQAKAAGAAPTPRKAPAKARSGAAAAGGRANALKRPLRPSPELAAVVGAGPLPRTEVVSKVWDHIRSNNLQNPENRREILADDALRPVFGKDRVSMFEMDKHLARHLD